MGRIREEYILHRYLELTTEDIQKRKKREKAREEGTIHPRLFAWHKRFTEKLDSCPYCGKTPKLSVTWDRRRGYDYKYECGFLKDGHEHDMGCGDWYRSLSRAGLSWNYRVREVLGGPHRIVRHKPLTQNDDWRY